MPLASVTAASRERGNQSVRKLFLICKAWMLLGRGSPNPRGPAADRRSTKDPRLGGSRIAWRRGRKLARPSWKAGVACLPKKEYPGRSNGSGAQGSKLSLRASFYAEQHTGVYGFLRSLRGRTELPTTLFRGQAPGAGTAPWARRSTWPLPREFPLQQSFLPLPRHPDRVQLPNLLRQ
jgi:hypothetical protein